MLSEGSYKKVFNKIENIKKQTQVDDNKIASWMYQIICGHDIDDGLRNLDNIKLSQFQINQIKKDITQIFHLLFGVEVMRHPTALVHNYMAFDLLLNNSIDWKKLLDLYSIEVSNKKCKNKSVRLLN